MSAKEFYTNTLPEVYYPLDSDTLEENLYLYFEYITTQTEEEVETYIYDNENFLTALGGNLGLFLGFSCLSVLLKLLEKILAKGIIKHQNVIL